jgi:hypothetical protein
MKISGFSANSYLEAPWEISKDRNWGANHGRICTNYGCDCLKHRCVFLPMMPGGGEFYGFIGKLR